MFVFLKVGFKVLELFFETTRKIVNSNQNIGEIYEFVHLFPLDVRIFIFTASPTIIYVFIIKRIYASLMRLKIFFFRCKKY